MFSIAAEQERSEGQFPILTRLSRFSHEFRPVIADVADFGIGFMHVHFVGVEGPDEVEWPLLYLFPVNVYPSGCADRCAGIDEPRSE